MSQGSKKSPWLMIVLLVGGACIVLPAACCAGVVYLGVGAVTAPLEAAASAMEQDPAIADKLGTPIEHEVIGITNYENNNGNGSAGIDTNFKGPKGSAHVKGSLILTAGEWRVQSLTVEFSDGSTASLGEAVTTEATPDETTTDDAGQGEQENGQ